MTARKVKLSQDDMAFLEDITADVVEASRVRLYEKIEIIGNDGQKHSFGPNTSDGVLIRPGGRGCYPAFWIRDFAMSVESGAITLSEQKHALLYTAQKQQEGEMITRSGSVVPHGAIADHISFEGIPIFFPGTIDDYFGQGGAYGKMPSYDDHYYFIKMAWHYIRASGDVDILNRDVRERKLIERLELAFSVPPSREGSHLVCCEEDNRGVTFGFCDSIIHTGDLLFCSVLKYRAAIQMSELHNLIGNKEAAKKYEAIALSIKENIPNTFGGSGGGLLRASTGISSQPDVWGSAFAVYVGMIEGEDARIIGETLARAYTDGTLSYRGNIRHVLTSDDFSEETAWERTVGTKPYPKNRYQNGAYWGTPVGWVCYAIAQVDESLAIRLAGEYISELREGDFRKGEDFGSPWECMHPDGDYKQNPVYMTSVTCPLGAFRKLHW